MRGLAALVLTLVLPSSSARALCKAPTLHPVVLADNIVAPADGGLVVAIEDDGARDDGDAQQPRWRFKTANAFADPVVVVLAPGLAVYGLPDKVSAADLHDGKAVRAHATRSYATIAQHAAPAVKSIHHTTTHSRRGNGSVTTVALVDGAPDDVLALVVLDPSTGKARSFGLVSSGATEINVYEQSRCSALPYGTVETVTGDSVVLRWVDRLGRLSAPTKTIKVANA